MNNERAVQFRRWANQIVKDYTIQGWVMDEERLKNGGTRLTQDYFEKQLAKAHAESEFEKYRIVQDRLYESDFDRFLLESGEKGEE